MNKQQRAAGGLVESAGIVLVQDLTEPAHRYMMLRAYRNWDFPKGVIEPGETPRATALRELREEAGLDESKVTFPGANTCFVTDAYTTRHAGKTASKRVTYFLAALKDPRVSLKMSQEHHEMRWVTYDEGRRLLVSRLQTVFDAANAFVCHGF